MTSGRTTESDLPTLSVDSAKDLDISTNDDFIYFTRRHREADIWMVTLPEENWRKNACYDFFFRKSKNRPACHIVFE
jgi:hypothetical protein